MGSLELPSHDGFATQVLPFVVRMAKQSELAEVAEFRSASYGKHLPHLAQQLMDTEASDYDLGCEVIVVRSKLDNSLLGTMRMHTNAFKALPLQASIKLGTQFRQTRMVETTRLCVKGSPNTSLVRTAMFKAQFHYCLQNDVDWMLAAGRRNVDRIYEGLRFSDVGEPGLFYPMAHAGGVPHRVMCLSPLEALGMWSVDHPLHIFIMGTQHKDIDLSSATHLNFAWNCPEGGAGPEISDSTYSDFSPVSRFDYLANTATGVNNVSSIPLNG